MKTIPINKAPYTAALYLRKCEERRNNRACRRINLFERIYRGTLLVFLALAFTFCGIALIQIALILSK